MNATVHRREIVSLSWEDKRKMRSQPRSLDLGRGSKERKRNLIMRRLCSSCVRNRPFRTNPAKWRGRRQPNNQTINHWRRGWLARAPALRGPRLRQPVNRRWSCRISTSKHTRRLRRLVKPSESTKLTHRFHHATRSSGTSYVLTETSTPSKDPLERFSLSLSLSENRVASRSLFPMIRSFFLLTSLFRFPRAEDKRTLFAMDKYLMRHRERIASVENRIDHWKTRAQRPLFVLSLSRKDAEGIKRNICPSELRLNDEIF